MLAASSTRSLQRVFARHLLEAPGLEADEGHGGAVALIQRFGSAANLNIHLHGLLLDGLYRCGADGVPQFVEAGSPTDDEVHALLQAIITRLMKMLTRRGVLVEEMGQTYLAEPDADGEEGVELVLDEARQFGAGAGLGVGDEAGRMLLHQAECPRVHWTALRAGALRDERLVAARRAHSAGGVARQCAGAWPVHFLNARLNAASDS